jgi:hypothetical protein
VFWTESGGLFRAAKDGAAFSNTPFAPMSSGAEGTTIAGDVFWVSDKAGSIRKTTLGGATVELVGNQGTAQEIAVDATTVYWTRRSAVGDGGTDGKLVRLAKGGATANEVIGGRPGIFSLGLDDLTLYWSETAGVFKCSKVGSCVAVSLFSSEGKNWPSRPLIALSLTDVLLVTTPTIYQIPKAGGTAVELASGNGLAGLAVFGGFVYYGESSAHTLWRIALNGLTEKQAVAPINNPVSGIAVDATGVYWTEYTNVPEGYTVVRKVLLPAASLD